MTLSASYKVEDIFEDIEGDAENILMNIPPEVLKEMGWKEGDVLQIEVSDGIVSITKKGKDE
jgi:antitoxin component of MazEF toxin-antitoxin module